MRTIEEIGKAEQKYFELVWLDRSRRHKPIGEAVKTAKDLEAKYAGDDEAGPYNDYEWGYISGKLAALRWAMGGDWDFLDT